MSASDGAGNRLLQHHELIPFLDQVESCLSRVEESPTQSLQNAISPSLKALVAELLFRHYDDDVKVAIAACIREITRITAPDAPYDDDHMKEVYQLIIVLSDKSRRSFTKRTSSFETVAKVRSCLVILDLECDALIIEMFQHFLKAVRDYHAEVVFTSMVTIVTLVLEVSQDLYVELLFLLLASVRRDNEEVLVAWRFAERVVENSASMLKPYPTKAVEIFGISFHDFSSVVAFLFQVTHGAVEQNDSATDKKVKDEEIPKGSLSKDPTSSVDDVSKEASEMKSDSEAKSNRRSGKKVASVVFNEDNASADVDETNKKCGTASDSDKKSLKQLSEKVDSSSNNVHGSLSRQLEQKKRCALGKVASKKDGTKTSTKNDDESVKPDKYDSLIRANPKTSSTRKQTPSKEKVSDSKEYDEDLVGLSVKVWPPKDQVLLFCFLRFCTFFAISCAKKDECEVGMKSMTVCFPYLLASTMVPSHMCCNAYISMSNRNDSCVCRLFDQAYTFDRQLNSTQILSLGGSCGRPSSILATCKELGILFPPLALAPAPAPAMATALLTITSPTSSPPPSTTMFLISPPSPFSTAPPLPVALVSSPPGRLPHVWQIVGIGLLSCLIIGLIVLTVYCLRLKYFPDRRAFDYKKCP